MKILIAYDGSDCADAALKDLEQAGLGGEAEVLVMSVADVFVPPPSDDEADNSVPLYLPEGIKRAHERAQDQLKQAETLAKRASEQIKSVFPNWSVRYEAQADSPAWALIRTADNWKSDLIIVGAQGHSVFGGRLILGSISQRVLYEARCSVRIARSSPGNAGKPLRLLVAVDNSSDSNAAVDAVCARHWPTGTEVGLFAVVDTVLAIPNLSQPSVAKWIEVGDEKNRDQVREVFEPSAERLRNAGLQTAVIIKRGNPAAEVVEEANSWGADCIFLGARGTRGIGRLLLGSVSSAVAARANCSVEVVRPSIQTL